MRPTSPEIPALQTFSKPWVECPVENSPKFRSKKYNYLLEQNKLLFLNRKLANKNYFDSYLLSDFMIRKIMRLFEKCINLENRKVKWRMTLQIKRVNTALMQRHLFENQQSLVKLWKVFVSVISSWVWPINHSLIRCWVKQETWINKVWCQLLFVGS